jgi:CheY-like chemotaxis protein
MENTNNRSHVFTILIADDDLDDQEFLKSAIKKFSPKIQVVCFANGSDLLEYLKIKERPDLIILDLNMPIKNGKETLSEIKTNTSLKDIPVLIYSTSRDPNEITSVYKLGVNSYISKFNNLKDLNVAIEQICSYWLNVVSLPNK